MRIMLHEHLITTISLLKNNTIQGYTCFHFSLLNIHAICYKNIHQKTKPSCIYQE